MAQNPIQFHEILSLSSTPISIKSEYVKMGTCSMESGRFIAVCEMKQSQIAIVELSPSHIVTRHKVSAEAAIMNPTSKIMAFRVGKILQLFDLEEQAVVKSHNSPDPVVYWRWATPNCVALVTSVAVFHWSLEDDAPPVKIFDRHPTLTQKRSTITNYHVSEDGKLCLLCSTHFVKASGVLEGFMQLYSIDRAVSQILQGHTGVFALLKLPDRAQVLLVDHKPNSESVFKLHIHEVGYDTATCGGEKFRADPGVIPVSTDAPGDYPVSMIVAKKTCLLYMVTKMGFVHVFDGFTGSLLCSTRVTRHDVLCVTAHAPTGGIFVISNIGKVLQVHIELSLLVPYLVLQLANEPLAVKVAVRLDLPEVNNLFTTRFESLLNAGDVKGAISTAVNSPHDCLRIPATMERLKSVSVGTGQPKPLYQFLYMLMENGKLNQSESLELARSATVSGRTQPLEKIFLEDKLSVSMELVSLVLTYDEKLALVMGRTQSDITVINYFLRQKEYDKLLIYARISQCKVDYVVQFERSVRNDRQGALNFAKSLARAKLIDPTVVVDLFVKAYQRRDATLFLQEVLTTNRSDQGALQTKLFEISLFSSTIFNSTPEAEAIFASKKYTYFDKLHIAPLCEKAGLPHAHWSFTRRWPTSSACC